MSSVEHKHLATFQCRPPKEYLELDNRWLQTVVLSVGTVAAAQPMIDNSLITALVDRWRPETHTFHMPCGEMAPTLQDVSYLLGLPIAGTAVGPRVVPASWKDDLEIRFAGVDRLDDLGALEPHPNARGLAKAWLFQFKATSLHPDTYDESVRRSLEAYLLWLFGFIMFKNGTSNSVDKRLRMHPRMLVPLWSWGSAVPAATYRGLCDACNKDESNARFRGCALLLRLWSYERLAVGRPIVDHRGYEARYYGRHDDDGPTMGTLWCSRRGKSCSLWVVFYVHVERDFVVYDDSLVYDIYIEPHRPHELCDGSGTRGGSVPRVIDRVTPRDHGYVPLCKMHHFKCISGKNARKRTIYILFQVESAWATMLGTWVTKVEPYVQAWDNVHRDVVHPVAPHTDWWYETFPTWYRPRTRCHVTYADTQPVPHESSSTDAYARHRDEALA
ncbi:hypothetical protein U9M48_026151 [Paspalum notatum var. saurae]|uniref:Aminotransferase-like plant mobile domain-containing protein n=1 Tax=Paspalum notatum var. saurae TaxID=547442 RepID=A0AAQ3TRS7_PASNO